MHFPNIGFELAVVMLQNMQLILEADHEKKIHVNRPTKRMQQNLTAPSLSASEPESAQQRGAEAVTSLQTPLTKI